MTHHLANLVRGANPAPDPETELDSTELRHLFAEIEHRTGQAPLVEIVRPTARLRRWELALATGVAIIAAMTVAIFLTATNQDDVTAPPTLPAPGESSSPAEILGAFYSKWNEGDVPGALAYVHPQARQAPGRGLQVGSLAWWENYLNYSVAAYGGDWKWILRDCAEVREDSVQCRVVVQGEPLLDARAVPSITQQFDTRDGLIVRMLVPADATLADIAVDQYAKAQDPEGHAAVCSIEGRELLGEFVVYDQPCGEFMAPYRLALADQILNESTVPSTP